MSRLYCSIAWAATVWVLLFGIGSSSSFSQTLPKDYKGETNYPSDIHLETLSRLGRPSLDEFTDPEEKASYEKQMAKDPTLFDRFHATAHRLHTPIIAEHYRESLYWLRAKGPLEEDMKALVRMVATVESNNYIEFGANGVSPAAAEVVKNRKDPSGLPEKEQVVIRIVRKMLHGPIVDSADYAAAKRLFGERGIVTLADFTVYYGANAMMFRLFDKQLLPGKKPPFELQYSK